MRKAIFIVQHCDGNVFPILKIATYLVKNGVVVRFYSTAKYQKLLQYLGVEFVDYAIDTSETPNQNYVTDYLQFDYINYLLASAYESIHFCSVIEQRLKEEIIEFSPSLIFHDCFSIVAKKVARDLSIRAINLIPSYVVNPKNTLHNLKRLFETSQQGIYAEEQFIADSKRYFRAERHLVRHYPWFTSLLDAVTSEENLNIAFSCKEFNLFANSFDSSYVFAGRLKGDAAHPVDKTQRKILISTGTIFTHEIEFYKKCIQAFNGKDFRIIRVPSATAKPPKRKHFRPICGIISAR